jgi:DNA modification methylase
MTTTDAPALSIAYWPIKRLVPYARNARTHSPAQVAEIAGSIRAFGFVNPVLVGGDGDIIAGHGRLAAARSLNLDLVPVIVLSGLSELQRRQLVLADNRIALNAGWDLAMLKLELTDLKGMGADLSALGFEKKELARLLVSADPGLTDEDDVPGVAAVAVSRPGDLWCLGNHRVGCGSSTDPAAVGGLLGDVVPNLMVTDPPYGVSYDPTWRHRMGVNSSARVGKVRNDDIADWSEAWALFPGQIAYVWHGALHATTVADSLIRTGFAIRSQIIWAKERLVIGRGDYHWRHEPCWYAVRKKGNWTGDRKQTTLWEIGSGGQDAETVHCTQKPVECMRRPILNNSIPGDAVYEPFLGSGTTLIATESTGRFCLAMELDPLYVDVAIRRWEAFTGKEATLLASGLTFAQMAEERAAGPPAASAEPVAANRANTDVTATRGDPVTAHGEKRSPSPALPCPAGADSSLPSSSPATEA